MLGPLEFSVMAVTCGYIKRCNSIKGVLKEDPSFKCNTCQFDQVLPCVLVGLDPILFKGEEIDFSVTSTTSFFRKVDAKFQLIIFAPKYLGLGFRYFQLTSSLSILSRLTNLI